MKQCWFLLFVAVGVIAVGVIAVIVVRQTGMLKKFLKTSKLLIQYFYFRILKFVDIESNEYRASEHLQLNLNEVSRSSSQNKMTLKNILSYFSELESRSPRQ